MAITGLLIVMLPRGSTKIFFYHEMVKYEELLMFKCGLNNDQALLQQMSQFGLEALTRGFY